MVSPCELSSEQPSEHAQLVQGASEGSCKSSYATISVLCQTSSFRHGRVDLIQAFYIARPGCLPLHAGGTNSVAGIFDARSVVITL